MTWMTTDGRHNPAGQPLSDPVSLKVLKPGNNNPRLAGDCCFSLECLGQEILTVRYMYLTFLYYGLNDLDELFAATGHPFCGGARTSPLINCASVRERFRCQCDNRLRVRVPGETGSCCGDYSCICNCYRRNILTARWCCTACVVGCGLIR